MLTTCKEAVKNSGHVHQDAFIDSDVGHHTLCFTLNLVHMSIAVQDVPKKSSRQISGASLTGHCQGQIIVFSTFTRAR